MKKLATYLLLFLLPLAACKKEYKYPEDPKKTRKSPNERLEGTWQISEYTLNGISIKDTLDRIAGFDISAYYLYYWHDDDFDTGWHFEIHGNFGDYSSRDAFKDYHYIVLRSYSELFNKIFVTPFKSVSNSVAKWTVTKLYDNDFRLQLATDTGEYKIKFIPKSF